MLINSSIDCKVNIFFSVLNVLNLQNRTRRENNRTSIIERMRAYRCKQQTVDGGVYDSTSRGQRICRRARRSRNYKSVRIKMGYASSVTIQVELCYLRNASLAYNYIVESSVRAYSLAVSNDFYVKHHSFFHRKAAVYNI